MLVAGLTDDSHTNIEAFVPRPLNKAVVSASLLPFRISGIRIVPVNELMDAGETCSGTAMAPHWRKINCGHNYIAQIEENVFSWSLQLRKQLMWQWSSGASAQLSSVFLDRGSNTSTQSWIKAVYFHLFKAIFKNPCRSINN